MGSESKIQEAPGLEPVRWTHILEREFLGLAGKEASERITVKERRRLEQLSQWRYRLKSQRAAEEVLEEYRRALVTEGLLSALKDYVEFFNPTGQTRHGPVGQNPKT